MSGSRKRVFLGGTCNGSEWREQLIPLLKIPYFNPVLPNLAWGEEDQAREYAVKQQCDLILYALTPYSDNIYSIAEAVDDSNKRPGRTFILLLKDDGEKSFSDTQWKHLKIVANLIEQNGARVVLNNIDELASCLNDRGENE